MATLVDVLTGFFVGAGISALLCDILGQAFITSTDE